MDLLLSLPIASYFLSNSLTSYSTSLNLLFFYITWSTLILSHSPLRIELMGVTAIRTLFWLLPSLLFLLFDTLLPSLAEGIKHGGASALPPRDARALSRQIALALLNFTLLVTLEGILSFSLGTLLRTPVLRTSTTLPLPWQMVKHVALLFAMREVLTYLIHRHALHSSPTTKRQRNRISVAALHESYAHARAAPPFSLLVMGDHPLPSLLHRFVPTYLPAMILALAPTPWDLLRSTGLGMGGSRSSWSLNNMVWGSDNLFTGSRLHLLTYFVFVGLSTLEETLSMSGYSIVPGIVMGGMARRTATHYTKPKTGNYGCWGVTDWVCGTGVGRDVMMDLRDEAEKHQLRERMEDAVPVATKKREKRR